MTAVLVLLLNRCAVTVQLLLYIIYSPWYLPARLPWTYGSNDNANYEKWLLSRYSPKVALTVQLTLHKFILLVIYPLDFPEITGQMTMHIMKIGCCLGSALSRLPLTTGQMPMQIMRNGCCLGTALTSLLLFNFQSVWFFSLLSARSTSLK